MVKRRRQGCRDLLTPPHQDGARRLRPRVLQGPSPPPPGAGTCALPMGKGDLGAAGTWERGLRGSRNPALQLPPPRSPLPAAGQECPRHRP